VGIVVQHAEKASVSSEDVSTPLRRGALSCAAPSATGVSSSAFETPWDASERARGMDAAPGLDPHAATTPSPARRLKPFIAAPSRTRRTHRLLDRPRHRAARAARGPRASAHPGSWRPGSRTLVTKA
jgi:hypothetical protein